MINSADYKISLLETTVLSICGFLIVCVFVLACVCVSVSLFAGKEKNTTVALVTQPCPPPSAPLAVTGHV